MADDQSLPLGADPDRQVPLTGVRDSWREVLRIPPPDLKELLKLVTGSAGLAYGALYIGYDVFYWTLGTKPDTVGLTYSSVLGQAAPAFAIMLGLALISYPLVRRIPPWRSIIVYLTAITVVLTIVVYRASEDAAHVKRGCPVRGVHFLGIPLVNITTPISQISWISLPSPRSSSAGPLMYLGTSATSVVVYDKAGQAPLLYPVGSVVVTITNAKC